MGRNNATLCISAVDVFKVCMTSLMPDDNQVESHLASESPFFQEGN